MKIIPRTHCIRGHELSAVGTMPIRGKTARCRECHREDARKAMRVQRARHEGDALPTTSIERDRFWSHVNHSDTCWLWTSADNGHGYGVLTVRGKNMLAHRVSYLLTVGDIPAGLELDHLCRNRGCVNPEHLEPVTHEENVRRSTAYRRVDGLCSRGHDNWVRYPSGGTHCRTCNIERKREMRAA